MPGPFPPIIPVLLEGGRRGRARCKYLPPSGVQSHQSSHLHNSPTEKPSAAQKSAFQASELPGPAFEGGYDIFQKINLRWISFLVKLTSFAFLRRPINEPGQEAYLWEAS